MGGRYSQNVDRSATWRHAKLRAVPIGFDLHSTDSGAVDCDAKWAASQSPFASRSVQRALLIPLANRGTLYRCGKST